MSGWVAGAVVVGGYVAGQGAKKAAGTAAAAEYAAIEEQKRQFDITQKQIEPWQEAGKRGLETYETMLNDYGEYEALIPSNIPEAYRSPEAPAPFEFTADDFETYKDPGYEFRVEEGLRALDRRLAASGQRKAGYRERGLMDLGQKLGSQEFGAARERAAADYTSRVASEAERYSRGLKDYGFQTAREAEEYERGKETYGRTYLDPLNRYGSLANVGQVTTQNLATQRANYAQNVASGMSKAGGLEAAGTLGQYGAYASAIGAAGKAYGANKTSAPTTVSYDMAKPEYYPAGDASGPSLEYYARK